MANGIILTVLFFFFHKVGTTVWPREFRHFVPKANSRGNISVAIPRFLLRKKKQKHCHSIRRGLIFLMVRLPLVYSSLVTLLWLIHRDSRHVRELTRRPWFEPLSATSSLALFFLNLGMIKVAVSNWSSKNLWWNCSVLSRMRRCFFVFKMWKGPIF